MLRDNGVDVDKLMSQDAARFLIQVYDRGRSSNYFARTLVDPCGFHEFPASRPFGDQAVIVIPKRADGFRQLTDDSHNPSCKIVRWNRKTCKNEDSFGVFAIGCENTNYMYKNNVTHYCRVLQNCNIRSNGRISKLGSPGAFMTLGSAVTLGHWHFVSIVTADPPGKPEKPTFPELDKMDN